MKQLCLGIDLGTVNSKGAYLDYRTGEARMPSSLDIGGSDHLPSVVLFEPDGKAVYVGEYARRAAVNFPDRSVRAVKRLMGKSWFHKLPGWESPWSPQGISALILKKILQHSQDDKHDTLGDLESATISVPASFGSRQREATIQAARLAGFSREIHLIDEPSAALIHFIYDRWEEMNSDFDQPTKILVFDMGGGTLDVSLAEVRPEHGQLSLEILSRSRYTELAGIEFDLRLAAYMTRYLETRGVISSPNSRDLKRLYRLALFDLAEPLKKGMSKYLKSHLRWGAYNFSGPPLDFDASDLSNGWSLIPSERELELDGKSFELENFFVPFKQFSQVLEPFFQPAVGENPDGTGTIYGPILKALGERGLDKKEIDIVLLHGGMCQMPLIRIGIRQFFPETTKIASTPNAMTSVAQGAALYQASRSGHEFDIHLAEPALFESIYYESKKGFTLIVDKDHREGESGVAQLPISAGAKTVRLRLYHGFSEGDPLLTYDRDLLIDLPEYADSNRTLELNWKVNPNRTVSFTWRDPENQLAWSELRESSTNRRQDWYPQEIYQAEANAVRQCLVK
jgi:molecular chaperone DnaK